MQEGSDLTPDQFCRLHKDVQKAFMTEHMNLAVLKQLASQSDVMSYMVNST